MLTEEQIKKIVELSTGYQVQRIDYKTISIDARTNAFLVNDDLKRVRIFLSYDAKILSPDAMIGTALVVLYVENRYSGNGFNVPFIQKQETESFVSNALIGCVFTSAELTYDDSWTVVGYHNLFYADCYLAN